MYQHKIFYAGTFWHASELKMFATLDAVDSVGNTVKLIRGRVIVTELHPSLVDAGFTIDDRGRAFHPNMALPMDAAAIALDAELAAIQLKRI